MGVGRHANLVYIIDFGLSKEFRDPTTHMHIPCNTGLGSTRTNNFASVNNHLGIELKRCNDLESLAYILIFLFCGFLPWQGSQNDILTLKLEITSHVMFEKLPVEIQSLLQYSQSLSFKAEPNYDQFYYLFNDALLQDGHKGGLSNLVFDWDVTRD